MSGDGFDIKEIVELDKRLARAIRKSPALYESMMDNVATAQLTNASRHLPHDVSGRLRASLRKQRYKAQKEWAIIRKGRDAVDVGTFTFYAKMVEDGHNQVYRARRRPGQKRRPRKIPKGKVAGLHYWKKGMQDTQRISIPRLARAYMKRVAREAGFNAQG